MDEEAHDHDGGLAEDLFRLIGRRRALQFLGGGVALAALAACGSSSDGSTAATATTGGATATTGASATVDDASCTTIPEETAGPYPGDGSNGPNVLTESGVVRRDIRPSFGSLSGTAEGVPLSVELTVLDIANGCTPLAGAAVYVWHCDRGGGYSLYSQGVTDQNYLRGVQETDSDGKVSFLSIYPACYSGRWPHIHFEVYPSLDTATSAGQRLATSQLAFPEDVCDVVYASEGYEQSVRNLSQISLDRDNVFSDGWSAQMATLTGDVTAGYTATLTVPV
jgi:protocatechuate 3,4-dioxygenase beta subunit